MGKQQHADWKRELLELYQIKNESKLTIGLDDNHKDIAKHLKSREAAIDVKEFMELMNLLGFNIDYPEYVPIWIIEGICLCDTLLIDMNHSNCKTQLHEALKHFQTKFRDIRESWDKIRNVCLVCLLCPQSVAVPCSN